MKRINNFKLWVQGTDGNECRA